MRHWITSFRLLQEAPIWSRMRSSARGRWAGVPRAPGHAGSVGSGAGVGRQVSRLPLVPRHRRADPKLEGGDGGMVRFEAASELESVPAIAAPERRTTGIDHDRRRRRPRPWHRRRPAVGCSAARHACTCSIASRPQSWIMRSVSSSVGSSLAPRGCAGRRAHGRRASPSAGSWPPPPAAAPPTGQVRVRPARARRRGHAAPSSPRTVPA